MHYEYYLPLSDLSQGFSWSHGSWSDCSAECGGGKHKGLGEGTVRLAVPMKGCNLCQDKGTLLGGNCPLRLLTKVSHSPLRLSEPPCTPL